MKSRLLAIAVFATLLSGCGREDYQVSWGKVYWGQKQSGWLVKQEIAAADVSSFEILSRVIARDKSAVYYLGRRIEGCSPESLELLGVDGYYCRDAQIRARGADDA